MKTSFLLTTALLFSCLTNAQSRIYVAQTAAGQNSGQSWTDAFSSLQNALHLAQPGDEIWVAEGVYVATSDSNRSISFELPSGVSLIGGFSGMETALSQRDWMLHNAILSGDIGVAGDSTDNTYNVLYMEIPDSNTVIDGFTIRDGVANNDVMAFDQRDRAICGGGIYAAAGNWEAFPNIRNCRIVHNTASNIGGGAMFYGTDDADVGPSFQNCIFENNHALSIGGGMARFGGTWTERGVDFEGCDFIENQSGLRGGGIYYVDGNGDNTIAIRNCSFIHNSAVFQGGGIYLLLGKSGKSGLKISNSYFSQNFADTGLGLKIFNNFNVFNGHILLDSSFIGNHIFPNKNVAIDVDLLASNNSNFEIKNSLFSNNNLREKLLSIALNSFGNIQFNQVTFSQNTALSILLYLSETNRIEIYNSVIKGNKSAYLGSFSNIAPDGYLNIFNSKFEKNNLSGTRKVFAVSHVNKIHIINSGFLHQKASYLFESNNIDSVFFTNNIMTDSIHKSYFPGTNNPPICLLKNNYFYSINCADQYPNVHCGPGILSGVDPMFRDTANGDYSLLPCSPLLDAGDNAAAAGILTDIIGTPRIQGGTIDIGPFEYTGLALAAPPLIGAACSNTPGGSIHIEPANGCEPYTYAWDPPAGNGPMLTELSPGNYSFTITDSRGRSLSNSIEIPSATSPQLHGTATDVQCGAITGGTATVSVTNGTGPFAFRWNTGETDSLIAMLPAGQFAVTVTDAHGCQDSTLMTVFQHGQLALLVNGTPIACFGDANGALSATPVNGKAPFDYQWSQGAVDSMLTDLGPGDYTVTVTDVYGCSAAFSFQLSDPPQLQINTTTTPASNLQMHNGSAKANVQGGSPGYVYSWSNGGATQLIGALAPGTYTVTVTDTHGCSVKATTEVMFVSRTSEATAASAQVWPNPMTDQLEVRVEGVSRFLRLTLQEASGKQVAMAEFVNGHAILDVRQLPKGAYIWTLWCENQELKRGLVIK